jgi:hypothetical protein
MSVLGANQIAGVNQCVSQDRLEIRPALSPKDRVTFRPVLPRRATR